MARRTEAQKAATRRMILANKAKRAKKSGKKFSVTVGKVGAKRKSGKVIGRIDRKPGKLYYVVGA